MPSPIYGPNYNSLYTTPKNTNTVPFLPVKTPPTSNFMNSLNISIGLGGIGSTGGTVTSTSFIPYEPFVQFPINIGTDIPDMIQLPKMKEKESPGDLSEYINSNTDGVGCVLFIIDAEGNFTSATNKFLMTGLSINYKERYQAVEAFNSVNVSFFGEAAKVYTFQGVAMDWAADDPEVYKNFHQSSLIKLYNDELRGTKLIEKNKIAAIQIVNHFITGYPLNFSVQYSSSNDKMAQFSMSWVVKDHTLSYAGTFTEKQLTTLYNPQIDGAAFSYVANIDILVKYLNKLLLFGKTCRNDSTTAELFPYLEVEDMLAISLVKIQTMPKEKRELFITTLKSTVEQLFEDIRNVAFNESNEISPFIFLYFKMSYDPEANPQVDDSELNNLRNDVITAVDHISESEAYSNFMRYVASLQNLKKDLLAHKARLIY